MVSRIYSETLTHYKRNHESDDVCEVIEHTVKLADCPRMSITKVHDKLNKSAQTVMLSNVDILMATGVAVGILPLDTRLYIHVYTYTFIHTHLYIHIYTYTFIYIPYCITREKCQCLRSSRVRIKRMYHYQRQILYLRAITYSWLQNANPPCLHMYRMPSY